MNRLAAVTTKWLYNRLPISWRTNYHLLKDRWLSTYLVTRRRTVSKISSKLGNFLTLYWNTNMDTQTHHWTGLCPDPDNAYGFVYEIVNTKNNRRYIGRKFYHKYSKRKKVGNNDWHFYCGSSVELKKDIQKIGKEHFTFTIIDEYKTRGGVVYGEVEWLVTLDVLRKKLDDGTFMYYNRCVPGIKFRPINEHTEIAKQKISLGVQKPPVSLINDDGVIVSGTREALCNTFGFNRGNLSSVLKGSRQTVGGYRLHEL